MDSSSVVSIGVAGALGPDVIGPLAAVVEQAGFHALWVNDTADGDSLAGLEAAAAHTSRLVLATGVIPVDRRPPEEIVAAVRERALPVDRLVLGIGAGGLRTGALDAVGNAARALRDDAGARVLIGALGPRMRRLGATHSDGALLSWLPPAAAAEQSTALHALAPRTHVAVYVRTAVDDGAVAARDAEARTYAGFPAYAANFARLGVDPLDTVLPRGDESLAAGVGAYVEAVDEVVLRAVTHGDGLDAKTRFVRDAAALLAG